MVEISDLQCCGLFADLNEREVAEMAKLATIEKRGAGSRLISEGARAANLYLLKEGKAAVRMTSRDGHEVLIDEVGSGALFGWSAVLDRQMFTAAVWAVEDCTLVVLDGEKLRRLFEANSQIGYRAIKEIASIVSSRLEHLRSRLADQPFAKQYLLPVRSSTTPVTGEKSEMRPVACPECSTTNRPFAIVNETEQYRCRNCGMIYYSPVGCETAELGAESARKTAPEVQLGDNWASSTPRGE
jgi:CRP-like cAMP-binding protein